MELIISVFQTTVRILDAMYIKCSLIQCLVTNKYLICFLYNVIYSIYKSFKVCGSWGRMNLTIEKRHWELFT